jgi:hypothetical protein
MPSKIASSSEVAPTPEKMQEVEFALVLSNIIDSLKNDPAHLRSAVYELARIKLQDQLANLDEQEAERLTQSLEIAILGVEDFSNRRDSPKSLSPAARSTALVPSRSSNQTKDEASLISAERNRIAETPAEALPILEQEQLDIGPRPPTRRRRLSLVSAGLLVVTGILASSVAYQRFQLFHQPPIKTTENNRPSIDDVPVSPSPPSPIISAVVPPAATRPAFPLPTTFGVYAVSADKLFELDMLPIRAPDRRIALSAAINTPSKTFLPDGRIKFIVFRRESSITAIERPEVRVLAKVIRAVTFEDGKANVAGKDDSWIIRNISRELKAAPIKDNPEMYEILGDDNEAPFSSGRYVLVLKGQAYDFTVEGTVTDLNQCLESTAAANGSFYSECRKR